MVVEKPSSGLPCGDWAGGPPRESENTEGRAPLPTVGLAEAGTDRVRIAGSPVEPLLLESGLGALVLEFLESGYRAEARFYDWLEAGADILLAPTLCATPACLKPLGLAQRAVEFNRAAVEVVRRATVGVSPAPSVAAQVGFLDPIWGRDRFVSFDEAFIHYHEQAKGLALGQPDLIVVRRVSDLRLLKAALVAIRELWSGPVLVLLDPARLQAADLPSLEEPLKLAAEVVSSLDIQGIGTEGVDQPAAVEAMARSMRERGFSLLGAALPAGAGVAPGIEAFARAGVDVVILEGAAGLSALRAFVPRRAAWSAGGQDRPVLEEAARAPASPEGEEPGKLVVALEVDWERRPGIGAPPPVQSGPTIPPERIGYSCVRILGHTEGLAAEGLRRHALEENVAAVEAAERRPILQVVRDPLVLEAGLKAASGRSIAYLDSLDTSLWESVFYLARRYGAQLALRLALASPRGPRETTSARSREPAGDICIPAILGLFQAAREYSLTPEDLFVDPMGFDEEGGWQREAIDLMLRQMPWAKRETGVRWILGCHRFREEVESRPFPSPALQAEILSSALFQGLDAVIVAPDQPHLIAAINAYQKP